MSRTINGDWESQDDDAQYAHTRGQMADALERGSEDERILRNTIDGLRMQWDVLMSQFAQGKTVNPDQILMTGTAIARSVGVVNELRTPIAEAA